MVGGDVMGRGRRRGSVVTSVRIAAGPVIVTGTIVGPHRVGRGRIG